MSDWNTTNLRPPESGYYLAAWWHNASGRYRVSELWFNDESGGSGWWNGRGYFLQNASPLGRAHHGTIPVVAWMPMPEYSPPAAGAPAPVNVPATDRSNWVAALVKEATCTKTPAADWTDDEWIAAMRQFPPDTQTDVVEAWVAQRRQSSGQHDREPQL